MNIFLFFKCILFGVIAASGCGPVFILTFNKGAICGFFKGFSTALGAACGDALYFFLGLMGALAVLSEFRGVMAWLDLIGGLVLIILGVHSVKKARDVGCVTIGCSENVFLSFGKSLLLTIFNPLIIFFFMAMSVQVLPDGVKRLPLGDVFFYASGVLLGSLSVLVLVSLLASSIGFCISSKKLKIISAVTGIGFICFGAYLLIDLVSKYTAFKIPGLL